MKANRRPRRKTIHSIDEIPVFRNEDEEHTFWSTHEMGDELWENAEPLPDEIVALLDRERERRAAEREHRAVSTPIRPREGA